MGDSVEEFEPLFDYSRVQPTTFFCVDDDDSDSSPVFLGAKRKKSSAPPEEKVKEDCKVVNVDVGGKEKEDEDWMPPPPPKIPKSGVGLEGNKTIQELRLKKQELASFAQSAEDVFRAVIESAKRELNSSGKYALESEGDQPPKVLKPRDERQKIIISIQDKDGHKPFRMYTDDKFERLFKMYAEKVNLKLESLVFSFDGDKVSPTSTPGDLGLENEDIIEVHVKPHQTGLYGLCIIKH